MQRGRGSSQILPLQKGVAGEGVKKGFGHVEGGHN